MRTRPRRVCLLKHQSSSALSPFAGLGKPREYFPAPTLKPAIKASQDACTASRGHSLASGVGNRLAALCGLRASAHSAMVLAPTVRHGSSLAGVATASGIGSAGLLTSHLITPRQWLCCWCKPQFGGVESEAGRAALPRLRASATQHLSDTRSEEA